MRLVGDDLVKAQARLAGGDEAEAGADRPERLEPVSRSRHRSRRRSLHQGADDVLGRHRHGCRPASEIDLEQSRAGSRAGGVEPRRRSSARRSATTSICATSRAARRCCCRKAKDNNASCAVGPLLRLFDKSFSLDDVRRMDVGLTVKGAGRFRARGPFLDRQDQPRSRPTSSRRPSGRCINIPTASRCSSAPCSRR